MTHHQIIYGSAHQMPQTDDDTVDLIVTSPPYPMIEMWDDVFCGQNKKIRTAFAKNDYGSAFEAMHRELDKVWASCYRVLKEGGIVCINIGDATRTLDSNFRLFSNHSRIIRGCVKAGFQNLPNIIWHKQTNAPNKFMGSGMLPPGAYVTLEHEYILLFRKGNKRAFQKGPEKENRRQSAYFWEERNTWFSEIWDVKGTSQALVDPQARDRSAAYPFTIPYRLINMFSVRDDTVLDPFLGTGTTSLAAIAACRNSVGFEIEETLRETIADCILKKETFINEWTSHRLYRHLQFVKEWEKDRRHKPFKYENVHYGFPVMTRQEVQLKIPFVNKIEATPDGFQATYFEEIGMKAPNAMELF